MRNLMIALMVAIALLFAAPVAQATCGIPGFPLCPDQDPCEGIECEPNTADVVLDISIDADAGLNSSHVTGYSDIEGCNDDGMYEVTHLDFESVSVGASSGIDVSVATDVTKEGVILGAAGCGGECGGWFVAGLVHGTMDLFPGFVAVGVNALNQGELSLDGNYATNGGNMNVDASSEFTTQVGGIVVLH